MTFRVLAVGDKFIPSDEYSRQLEKMRRDFPVLNSVELTAIEWDLPKADQHRLQQVMEWDGANAVDAPPEMLAAVREADALIVHFAPVNGDIISAGANLAMIAVARAGLENVDKNAADERGIRVTGVQGRNAAAVAELAIGLMLSECRNISRADQSIKSGGWRKDFSVPMVELGESTVGIIGAGQVAKRLVEKLQGLAGNILIHDPYVSEDAIVAMGAKPARFDQVFQESDFVHIMARLTPDTERFIGETQFRLMKKTAYFINTARSRLVDYDALYAALASGEIAGAGLDVFDDEPLSDDSPWRQLDNVTMTTHYGGDTTGTNMTSARLVLAELASFLDSQAGD
jgi:D-3-phosphoglycerate dehydrogenase